MSYINSWEEKKEIHKDIKEGYMGVVRKSRFKISKCAKITDFVDICVQTDSSKVEISFLKTN